MQTWADSLPANGTRFSDLVFYLNATGWRIGVGSNVKWLVYEGPADVGGSPVEIVLPQDADAPDVPSHLSHAINTLSALAGESAHQIARRVKYFDRDVLVIRNLETGDGDSITLQLATEQIAELKRLVSYSASSERDPRPHFLAALDIGGRMAERFRFGHTVRGSFGFTVESPTVQAPLEVQGSLLPSLVEAQVDLPFERRVMERIVRGLRTAKEATQERDIGKLVKGYAEGFNSNMCTALVKMSKGKLLPVEYGVMWSPRVRVSKDVAEVGTVRLTRLSYDYLDEASEKLKALKPEEVTIRGRVVELRSGDDPLGLGTRRSVVVRWIDRPGGRRPRHVLIPLGRDEYEEAISAHHYWRTIEVSGVLERVGTSWRLSDPHRFQVVR